MSLLVPAEMSVNENGMDFGVPNTPSAQVAVIGCSLDLERISVPKISLQAQASWTKVPTLNGGTISPWNTGDVFDGGTISPWNTGDSYFGGYVDYLPPNISIQMVLLH